MAEDDRVDPLAPFRQVAALPRDVPEYLRVLGAGAIGLCGVVYYALRGREFAAYASG